MGARDGAAKLIPLWPGQTGRLPPRARSPTLPRSQEQRPAPSQGQWNQALGQAHRRGEEELGWARVHEAQDEPATGAAGSRAAREWLRGSLTSAEPGSALLKAVAALVQESLAGAWTGRAARGCKTESQGRAGEPPGWRSPSQLSCPMQGAGAALAASPDFPTSSHSKKRASLYFIRYLLWKARQQLLVHIREKAVPLLRVLTWS